jgi:hypothetical protein
VTEDERRLAEILLFALNSLKTQREAMRDLLIAVAASEETLKVQQPAFHAAIAQAKSHLHDRFDEPQLIADVHFEETVAELQVLIDRSKGS